MEAPVPPSHENNSLRTRSLADVPFSWINGELIKQFDLFRCALLGLPQMLAFPLRTKALAHVPLDRL